MRVASDTNAVLQVSLALRCPAKVAAELRASRSSLRGMPRGADRQGVMVDEMKDPVERVNYFFGQLLQADDFRSDQDYHRSKAQLHNRMLHGSGIVGGLEVTSQNDRLNVDPGLAIDGYGREIFVAEPQTVDVSAAPTEPGTFWLCLCYREVGVDPIPIAEGLEPHPTRIREALTLAFVNPDRCPEGCIVLAEVTISGGTFEAIVERAQRIPRVTDLLGEIADLKRRLDDLKP